MRLILGWAIIAVWIGAAVDGLVRKDYMVLDRVTPVALIVAGWMFGLQVVRRKNGKPNGSPPPDE